MEEYVCKKEQRVFGLNESPVQPEISLSQRILQFVPLGKEKLVPNSRKSTRVYSLNIHSFSTLELRTMQNCKRENSNDVPAEAKFDDDDSSDYMESLSSGSTNASSMHSPLHELAINKTPEEDLSEIMCIELNRKISFWNFPLGHLISIQDLWSNGFYFIQDKVKCCNCKFEHSNIQPQDDIIWFHRQVSPDCHYALDFGPSHTSQNVGDSGYDNNTGTRSYNNSKCTVIYERPSQITQQQQQQQQHAGLDKNLQEGVGKQPGLTIYIGKQHGDKRGQATGGFGDVQVQRPRQPEIPTQHPMQHQDGLNQHSQLDREHRPLFCDTCGEEMTNSRHPSDSVPRLCQVCLSTGQSDSGTEGSTEFSPTDSSDDAQQQGAVGPARNVPLLDENVEQAVQQIRLGRTVPVEAEPLRHVALVGTGWAAPSVPVSARFRNLWRPI